ncbi:MAG: IPT/TIG domain-containing protein [Treponema sp.]|jgi:transglutaminase-like putative cysteine protease|nr:IPT/TIG domain-containing protein [Treponema sp.]
MSNPGNLLLRFLFIPAVVVFSPGCKEGDPRISEISPRIGMMGEVLTISGENFGDEQDESSYVTLAGIAPTASSYIEWKDNRISLRVPEFGESGLVYVYRGTRKSNPALFSNRAAIPEPVSPEQAGIGPQILAVTPASGAIGQLVTITGNNFGASREGSGVYFAWGAEAPVSAPAGIGGPAWVEVSDSVGYDLWGEREIRVWVPDGAMSGSLEVRTPRGASIPQFFSVTGKPGTKVYKDKRIYILSYSVDIHVREASSSNTLYLWIPQPVISASQRSPEILSQSAEPYIENYRGVSLYRFRDLKVGSGAGIALSYSVEVYAVETSLNPSQIRIPRQDSPSFMAAAYAAPSSLIPSDDPEVRRYSQAIIGREQNPYLKARRIYEWLLKEGNIRWEALNGGARDGLVKKQADPYMAALLFCALARSGGVPARPVAGILVDKAQGAFRHVWAEFWIDGAGWIPADPALGAGAVPPSFTVRQDHRAYYFGSVDNQRIAFSQGQVSLSRMDPRGRTVVRERDYALQNLWEEAAGGIESYSSLWSDIAINGVYVQ